MMNTYQKFLMLLSYINNKVNFSRRIIYHNQQMNAKDQTLEALELQGDKKIIKIVYLSPNTLKRIFLGLPLIVSVIGIYFLIKSQLFRSKILYNTFDNFDSEKVTHIYTENNDEQTQIVKIDHEKYQQKTHYTFVSHNLKYEILSNKVVPVGSKQTELIEKAILQFQKDSKSSSGISTFDHNERLNFYGHNEHNIQIPNYFVYSFNVMTEPLFLFQYVMVLNWFLHGLLVQSFIMVGMLSVMVVVNYLFVYFHLKKIKMQFQKQYTVKVLRQSGYEEIQCTKLVPGDLYIVKDTIPCDSVLISRGQIIVNEANFTGQNIPILKSRIRSVQAIENRSHWIYDGSQIIQKKGQVLVMAIYTGYTSHRGRIIRKIINISIKEPAFTKSIILFSIINVMVTSLVFLSIIPMLQQMLMTPAKIASEYVFMVGFSLSFVGFIYMFPSFSMRRLKQMQINGNQAYKIYEVGQVKLICFDKTGTLTQNRIQLSKIYKIDKGQCKEVSENIEKEQELIRLLFASCHMVKAVEGDSQLKGDQIDLRMWEKSKAEMVKNKDQNILWSVKLDKTQLDVLRINQFESKFSSMSILVKDRTSNRYYIFVKGSPQLLQSNATNDCQKIPQLLKQINLQGYRAIGFAYKIISQEELNFYMKTDRQAYLQGISMLGVVSFINELKEEAPGVISRLREECGIKVQMITGDNIYTAVKTGLRTGIISQGEDIAIFQHKNIVDPEQLKVKVTIISIHNKDSTYKETQIIVDSFVDYLVNCPSNIVFAIDSYFLCPQLYQLSVLTKIRIFARMSPEHKTQIISNIQQSLEKQYDSRSIFAKIFGTYRSNVSMVGDGANDLMAIKEADVGFGINESDGTFSADFVIKKLSDIEKVIRQGKSVSQRALQAIYIPASVNWLNIPLLILMYKGMSTFSQVSLIIGVVYYFMPIPFFLSITRPSSQNTRLLANNNFMSGINYCKFWFVNIVFSAAFLLAYICLWSSPTYIHIKPYPISLLTHLQSVTQSSTLFFKILLIYIMGVVLIYYDYKIFKQPLWGHPIIKKWFIIGGVVFVVGEFFSDKIPFMANVHLQYLLILEVIGIVVAATVICYFTVRLIPSYYLDPVFDKQESQNKK